VLHKTKIVRSILAKYSLAQTDRTKIKFRTDNQPTFLRMEIRSCQSAF